MSNKKVGDRVETEDGPGTVRMIHRAGDLYPGTPLYKKRDTKSTRTDTKYPPDDPIYQVELDAQPLHEDGPKKGQPRFRTPVLQNYHQSQIGE